MVVAFNIAADSSLSKRRIWAERGEFVSRGLGTPRGARSPELRATGLTQRGFFPFQVRLQQRKELSLDRDEASEGLQLPFGAGHHRPIVTGHRELAAACHLVRKPG